MAIDLNMDLSALLKALMKKTGLGESVGSGGIAASMKKFGISDETPYHKVILAAILIILIAMAFSSFYYTPKRDSNLKKLEEIKKLHGMQEEFPSLDSQANSYIKKIESSRDHDLEQLSRFSEDDDLGEVYRAVSALAIKHNLMVINTTELEKKENKVDDKNAMKSVENRVNIELNGNYNEYINFKSDLANMGKLLKVNSESIKSNTEKSMLGMVNVQMQLSAFTIDKAPILKIISNGKDLQNKEEIIDDENEEKNSDSEDTGA